MSSSRAENSWPRLRRLQLLDHDRLHHGPRRHRLRARSVRGAFLISHRQIRLPSRGEASTPSTGPVPMLSRGCRGISPPPLGQMGRTFTSRPIPSLVADFHRTYAQGRRLPLSAHRAISGGELHATCNMKPIRSPFWPSKPAAWPSTANRTFSTTRRLHQERRSWSVAVRRSRR